MNNKKIDIIEVVLKEDLNIMLEPDERTLIDNLDDEFKAEIIALVNNENYLDEIEKITENIIKKYSNLSEAEKRDIEEKCSNRINTLKHSNSLSRIKTYNNKK